MAIAHDPDHGWFSITTDPAWPTRGAPDAVSAGHAARVQHLSMSQWLALPAVDYIVEFYGESRENAEAIVRNCSVNSE
jgi:hypothetical protein